MKKIIVFYGNKGVGKDTSFNMFNKYEFVYKQVSFADPVKETVWSLFGKKIGDKERLYGAIEKKEEIIEGWEIPANLGFKEKYWTGRRLLQWFGTDVCRNVYGQIWVDKAEEQIRKHDHVGITDCRFLNEYELLKRLKGEYDVNFVHVLRKSMGNSEFSTHASEIDMDKFSPNYIIYNNKTLFELEENVKEVIKYFGG
jgi:hypothetical protein